MSKSGLFGAPQNIHEELAVGVDHTERLAHALAVLVALASDPEGAGSAREPSYDGLEAGGLQVPVDPEVDHSSEQQVAAEAGDARVERKTVNDRATGDHH
jgi:hypothetical protein